MKLLRRKKKTSKKVDNRNILLPPEGVPLEFEVAGVGVRMGAQITDVLITTIGAIAFILCLVFLNLTSEQSLLAIFSLLFFFIRIPYYVFSELAWNGQTFGKRVMKIKVVSNDGGPLTTHALVVRNLMKEAEVFLPGTLLFALSVETPIGTLLALVWIFACLGVPLFNKRRRRLGDLIAGTYVIHLPVPILLKDLAGNVSMTAASDEGFSFLSHHLDHYGAFELQTLESMLRAQQINPNSPAAHSKQTATRSVVVDKIRNKIGYADAVPTHREVDFLMAFYNAQRAHLEQKQLFGEKRADKHHAKEETTD